MTLFKNKYRIESTRLPFYDYSSPGCYFITICVRDGHYDFGQIKNKRMKLSKLGHAARKYWKKIPKHFPFVKLDEFIVMPNHVHGIIIITKKPQNAQYVETQDFASLPLRRNGHHNKFGPQSRNLASIIRGYKIGVKKYANKKNKEFFWQAGFYDHIINTDEALNNIRQYIINNPTNWQKDRNIK